MHEVVLALHVTAGAVGLLIAPVAAFARKARGVHTITGWTYQLCVLLLCSTALVLVALDPTQWPFVLIALATAGAAVAGVVVRRRRRPGWLPLHVQLQLGSYVSFVTAFSVQTVGGLVGWLVPAVAGSAAVACVTTRVTRRQVRPAAPPLVAG